MAKKKKVRLPETKIKAGTKHKKSKRREKAEKEVEKYMKKMK